MSCSCIGSLSSDNTFGAVPGHIASKAATLIPVVGLLWGNGILQQISEAKPIRTRELQVQNQYQVGLMLNAIFSIAILATLIGLGMIPPGEAMICFSIAMGILGFLAILMGVFTLQNASRM